MLVTGSCLACSCPQGDGDSCPGGGQPAEERPSPRCVRNLQRLRGRVVLPRRPQREREGEEGAGASGAREAAATEIHVSGTHTVQVTVEQCGSINMMLLLSC